MSEIVQRLDAYMAAQGLASSREMAKKLISASCVTVNGVVAKKPSLSVSTADEISVLDNTLTQYVSRGAFKLVGALDYFGIDVGGMVAVDFGASTGGFTDVLLKRGAKHVYAIENGSNQLHPDILNDSRVTSFDNTNGRYIQKGFIPLCDIAVMDVSFISQTKLYNSVTNVLKDGGIFISLIKPQFEAGREAIGKNGIIKDTAVHNQVKEKIIREAELYGLTHMGTTPSTILGGDGNKEFLAYFIYNARE